MSIHSVETGSAMHDPDAGDFTEMKLRDDNQRRQGCTCTHVCSSTDARDNDTQVLHDSLQG